jgi:Family of unknown function (DUF5683)
MRSLAIFLLAAIIGGEALADDPLPEGLNDVLVHRAEITAKLRENLQQEMQDEEGAAGATKSVGRSVLYSAVVPGLGQFYTKSYIKAGLFAAVEIAAWATNIHYNNLGDDKDAEYRGFANQNWSEQRYWSYIYKELQEGTSPPGLPFYQTYVDQNGRPIIVDSEYSEARDYLRQYEQELLGFTHTLPDTKTQQYYEMIGKYPEQFGNAWADASFDADYSGFQGRVTAMNDHYTDLSKESESLYDKAGYGSMAALINHVISAVDAGFTTRRYNRRQMKLSYDNRIYNGEFVNMFGVAFIW